MKIFREYLTGIFILSLLVSTGCEAQEPSITVDSLQTLLENDSTTVLIDVRNESEFVGTMSKIEKAMHIPLGELEQRSGELDQYKERPIYFICRSGNRSAHATNMFLQKGFNAVNVTGGMLAYSKKFRKEE